MKKIFILILLTIHLFGNTIEIAKNLFDNQEKHKEAIEIFQKYPDDPESQYYLGKAYYFGMGVNKDLKKSFEYAKKSADKNNSSGLNLLGVMYQNGEGVEKDESKAFEYYKQSTDLGNTKAMRNLALVFGDGVVIKQDFNRVVEIYQKMINLKNIYGYLGLASINTYHTKDYNEALKYYLLFEKNGGKESNSFQNMAVLYRKLNNTEKEIEYHRKATELGNDHSMLILFDLLEKKENKKYRLYENEHFDKLIKSAELGNSEAILEIIYNENSLKVIGEEKLLNWMKKGVELKLDPAYNKLYGYYLNNKDHKNLKLFLEKAYYEDKNFEMGCNLANYLSYDNLMEGNDFSITYNPKESLKIINEIILQHPFHEKISSCYTTLAYFYVQGNYLEKNYEKAIEIYKQIKQNYSAPYLQKFSSESINDFERKIKEEKSIENNSISKNINDENNLFTVIENFSKVEQVATVLTSENYYFISTSDKAIKVIDKRTLQPIKELRGYISTGAVFIS
jgi:TPR repeat protein